MKNGRLFLVFAITFVLGFGCAYLVVAPDGKPITTDAKQDVSPSSDAVPQPKPQNDDSADNAWPDDADSPEQVLYAQTQRMQEAIDKLTPRIAGRVNMYVVAFAGVGEENVFRNEAEFVARQFEQRFDAAGHTLLLVNNPQTLQTLPLANLTNLETAVDAIAERMDADNDILLLFMTSHGSADHVLSVSMDPLPLDQIAPDDLSDVLGESHIRNKVLIISACYSGGFVKPLEGDTTMVITAAREDRSSFGCGTDSDITDFGRAFFVEGLNHTDSFTAAFDVAKSLVDAWEVRDRRKAFVSADIDHAANRKRAQEMAARHSSRTAGSVRDAALNSTYGRSDRVALNAARAATAVSGKSQNTASTPSANAACSSAVEDSNGAGG